MKSVPGVIFDFYDQCGDTQYPTSFLAFQLYAGSQLSFYVPATGFAITYYELPPTRIIIE